MLLNWYIGISLNSVKVFIAKIESIIYILPY